MSLSPLEQLNAGLSIRVPATDLAVEVKPDRIWVHGCDCSAEMGAADVRVLHEALGAWLRRQKNRKTP